LPPPPPRGPLSGIPVVFQWIGVGAAVITAGMGLGHLYVEITEPPQLGSIVERRPIPERDPAVLSVDEPWFEPPETTPTEIEQKALPSIIASTPVPLPAPAGPSPVADPIVVYRPVPVVRDPPKPLVHEAAFVESEQKATLEERLRSRLGDPQVLTDPSSFDPEQPVDASAELGGGVRQQIVGLEMAWLPISPQSSFAGRRLGDRCARRLRLSELSRGD